MMRVLEFLVALVIVAVAAVVGGLVSPSSGHVDRSLTIGKDLRQVYDVLDNLRRLPEYAPLRQEDRNMQFTLSGKSFGPGAQINWTSQVEGVGNGSIIIDSAKPNFNEVDDSVTDAEIIWKLQNSWRGLDKHFTISLKRDGSRGQLTAVNWAYDVQYGWNLVDRFSNIYIHGKPDTFIQSSLNNLQNVLAGVPNVDYTGLAPAIVQTKAQPVLLLPTSVERKAGLDGVRDAVAAAVKTLDATAKRLKVNVVGPRILVTSNYGDETYSFDIALPIDANALVVTKDGEAMDLTVPKAATLSSAEQEEPAPAESSSSAQAAPAPVAEAGTRDSADRLVVGGGVLAELMPGGAALTAEVTGNHSGVAQVRDELRAYAQTHGYKFDVIVHNPYDVQTGVESLDPSGQVATREKYAVYLPLTDAPEQTPEQEAGLATAPAAASTAATEAAQGVVEAPAKKAAPKKAAAKK